MFVQTSAVLAVFAVAAQVAYALPPACVLAAVNTQSDPSDFKTVCGATDVQDYLTKNCGNSIKEAQSYFEDFCKDHDQTVSSSSSSDASSTMADASSTMADASATMSAPSYASASASATSGSSGSGSGSGTAPMGTGSPSGFATASANSTYSGHMSPGTPPTATASGGAAQSTGAASSLRIGMDVVGMAALGVAGVMLAL